MFNMSKEELLARMVSAVELTNKNGDGNNKLILLLPYGIVVCDDAEIPTADEITSAASGAVSDLALALELPKEINFEAERFIYCKNVKIISSANSSITVPFMCIALRDVQGISIGNPQ